MTDEDLAAVAARTKAHADKLGQSNYPLQREALNRALENIDHFTNESALSLAGARHWVRQAQRELDQMHALLVAAEAV